LEWINRNVEPVSAGDSRAQRHSNT
jgi:hypothetical protein